MKRFMFIVSFLVIFLFAGCSQETSNVPDKESEGRIISLIPPDNGFSWYWAPSYLADDISFSDTPFESREHMPNVTVVRTGPESYDIEGEKYVLSGNPDPITTPVREYYGWWFDKSFFYKYADVSGGGALFRNTNVESLDVIVYITEEGDEILLLKENSPLSDFQLLSIEFFGSVVLNDIAFAEAKQYEAILNAHISGANENKASISGYFEDSGTEYWTQIDFECKLVPGLRYTVFAVDYPQTTGECFVYSRNLKCFVSIKTSDEMPIAGLFADYRTRN